jgi:hypothetical protein
MRPRHAHHTQGFHKARALATGRWRHAGSLSDYELVWPADLFAAEARRIVGRPGLGQDATDLLLREAFRDENAAEDISALSVREFGAPHIPPPIWSRN